MRIKIKGTGSTNDVAEVWHEFKNISDKLTISPFGLVYVEVNANDYPEYFNSRINEIIEKYDRKILWYFEIEDNSGKVTIDILGSGRISPLLVKRGRSIVVDFAGRHSL